MAKTDMLHDTTHDGRTRIDQFIRTINVTFKAGSSQVRINEVRHKDEYYKALIKINKEDYETLKNEDVGDDTWEVILELVEGKTFTIDETDRGRLWRSAKRQGDRDRILDVIGCGFQLCVNEYELGACRYVQIIIPEYSKSGKVDPTNIRQILGGSYLHEPRSNIEHYITENQRSWDIVHDYERKQHDSLARDDVTCTFLLRGDRLWIQMTDNPNNETGIDAWKLESQQVVFFTLGFSRDSTLENVKTYGLFSIAPPRLPPKDAWQGMPSVWVGRTIVNQHGLWAVIVNNISDLDPQLIQAIHNTRRNRIRVHVEFDETQQKRINKAISDTHLILQFEAGTLETRDEDGKLIPMPCFVDQPMHISPSDLLLPDLWSPSHDVAPFPLKSGYTATDIGRDSHGCNATQIRAITESIFSSLNCIQGPPATGKTWTEAHLVNEIDDKVDQLGRKTVVTAATNIAVHVAAERCFRVLSQSRLNEDEARDKLVIVDTEEKNFYDRLASKHSEITSQLTLTAHLMRMALEQPDKYHDFLEGENLRSTTGVIHATKLLNAHDKQRRELIQELKEWKDVIIFATLATIHVKDSFFGSPAAKHGDRTLPCSYMIVDEASQVTPMLFAQAYNCLNPMAVKLLGDDQQLCPHVEVEQKDQSAKTWLELSILNIHMNKAPSIMLNLQYRCREEIWAGTNVHYNGAVQTARKPDSAFYTKFMNNISRVSFTDSAQKDVVLKHNVSFFNIPGGVCQKVTSTKSSINMEEASFLHGLLGCLLFCGLEAENMVILNGYNGQNDVLKQLLSPWGIKTVKIDGFQGGEAPAIFFSCVRDIIQHIGFLGRGDRQNVGTSRAQDVQIFAGSRAMFDAAAAKRPEWSNTLNALASHRTNLGKFWVDVTTPVIWKVDGKVITPADVNKVLSSQMPAKFQHPEIIETPEVDVDDKSDDDFEELRVQEFRPSLYQIAEKSRQQSC